MPHGRYSSTPRYRIQNPSGEQVSHGPESRLFINFHTTLSDCGWKRFIYSRYLSTSKSAWLSSHPRY